MALSNRDRIQRGLETFRAGLTPFVEREMKSRSGVDWRSDVDKYSKFPIERTKDGEIAWDTTALIGAILDWWDGVFSDTFGPAQRSLIHEVRTVRNDWAHEKNFSTDATYRALDSMRLLLESISAGDQARELNQFAGDVLRVKFTEQARTQGRRVEAAEGKPLSGLPPWREVITPHKDVAAGRYQQAEFAADLAQVYRDEGVDEYLDPVEFYSRTYLTEGLSHLLSNALRRLGGQGGDPVVELQTNFGGGKTHSMLALYHLFSGTRAQDLTGVGPLLESVGEKFAVKANRAVLVGTALSPGQTDTKSDGTVVGTLWGELAWQLGGAEGYAMISDLDRTKTSPGSNALTELFRTFSPCLILIDEWVAYLRNLYKVDGLPAGSFDANLTFAQALTEAAKAAPETLVVASLPASQIEIGGEGGEEALIRLKQTFSRVESTWRPASAEEGFEIVRRRLFQEDTEKHPARDLVVRRFSEMYREQSGAFPSGCGEKDYEMRMRASYPIHPELFERLYTDWGSLEKFQRTRGVLRLMAAVIHALWEGEDKNLIITSSTIPMEDKAVQSELTRYMDDSWDTVINKDVDGPNSLPLRIDRETPNLGRYSATRRVARTVYMGSAPTSGGRNPGIEEKAVMLGCVQPGETVATFGDALRRLSDNATYLYVDARRYWYSTQVGVTRLAQDRADQYDTDDVRQEIVRRLRKEIGGKGRGGFAGVHVAPESSADVPDEREARLVVFGPDHAHALRNDASDARREAERTLSGRGTNPRIYRNTLAFLAPDRQRIGDLEVRVRQYLAWDSICSDAEVLNLAPIAERQARGKREESDRAVVSQIAEVWSLCLAPEQPDPRGKVEWVDLKTTGTDGLVARASRKLQDEEMLVPALGAARLGMELSKVWADSDHIQIKRLWEYLCSYVYLLRLTSSDVLLGAIREAVSGLLESEEFAYAERHDEVTGRYRGLRLTGGGSVVMDSESVLVRMEVARRQLADDEERRRQESGTTPPPPTGSGAPSGEETSPPTPSGGGSAPPETPPAPPVESPPRRFYGSVDLDTNRVGRDAGKIAEEILTHLAALPGARVRVTLDIEADIPEGVTDRVQRVVSENASTLKFKSSGFERE